MRVIDQRRFPPASPKLVEGRRAEKRLLPTRDCAGGFKDDGEPVRPALSKPEFKPGLRGHTNDELKVRGFHRGQGTKVSPAKGRIYVSNRFSAARDCLAPRLGPYVFERRNLLFAARSPNRYRTMANRVQHPPTTLCPRLPAAGAGGFPPTRFLDFLDAKCPMQLSHSSWTKKAVRSILRLDAVSTSKCTPLRLVLPVSPDLQKSPRMACDHQVLIGWQVRMQRRGCRLCLSADHVRGSPLRPAPALASGSPGRSPLGSEQHFRQPRR